MRVISVAYLAAAARLFASAEPNSSSVRGSDCSAESNTKLHNKAKQMFDLDHATMHAELATAAYCGASSQVDDRALTSWSCGAPCEKFKMKEVRVVTADEGKHDAYAFMARTADGFDWPGAECILSFRGTTDVSGWVNNLLSGGHASLQTWTDVPCEKDGKKCQVGIGWIHVYNSYREYIQGNLTEMGCGHGEAITITGHSLGGAQAGLAMLDLKQKGWDVIPSYNFGSPRIGDETFDEVFYSHFPDLQLFRVTHHHDPVPHVPTMSMGYHHLNMEIYFDKAGYKVSDGSGEDECMSMQYGDDTKQVLSLVGICVGELLLGGCDHLTYMKKYTGHKMTGEACSYPGSFLEPGVTLV